MGSQRSILPPLFPHIRSFFFCRANTNSFSDKINVGSISLLCYYCPPQLKARYSASLTQGLHILVPLVCHSVIVLTLWRWIDLYTAWANCSDNIHRYHTSTSKQWWSFLEGLDSEEFNLKTCLIIKWSIKKLYFWKFCKNWKMMEREATFTAVG